jgi:hypothetical protein
LVLARAYLHEIEFHLRAHAVAGKVVAYGVEARGDGGGGANGSYTTLRQWPWLDVAPRQPGAGPSCRVDGTGPIFGDIVDADPVELKRRLARLAADAGLIYYALPGAKPSDDDCRLAQRLDWLTLSAFALLATLASVMACLAWRALDDPEFHHKDQHHD